MTLLRSLTFEGVGASVDGEFPYYDGVKYSPRFLYDYFAGVNGFRVTTESGVPVSTSDRTAQSTLYLTPHNGNAIALHDGTRWYIRESAEVSITLSGLTSGRGYDVFAYWTGSAVALELLAWASATARATEWEWLDGVRVKVGDSTRRLVASFYAVSATTTADADAQRLVYNFSNQVSRRVKKNAYSIHSYSTGVWRAWNNNSANKIEVFVGEPTWASAHLVAGQTTSVSTHRVATAITLDAASPATGVNPISMSVAPSAAYAIYGASSVLAVPLGYHTLDVREAGGGSGTQSFEYYLATGELPC